MLFERAKESDTQGRSEMANAALSVINPETGGLAELANGICNAEGMLDISVEDFIGKFDGQYIEPRRKGAYFSVPMESLDKSVVESLAKLAQGDELKEAVAILSEGRAKNPNCVAEVVVWNKD